MALLFRNLRCFRVNSDFVKVSARYSNTLSNNTVEAHRSSLFNTQRVVEPSKELPPAPDNFMDANPDFFPNPDARKRDRISEMLERSDMLKRRSVIDIPEFYVGTIMAVTFKDKHSPSPDSKNRFVGICVQRIGHGLRSSFTLRNAIDGQGIEISYDLYCPLLLEIEVLRLEKRLDNELFYLRDAPLDYSTFPFDMVAIQLAPNEPVPINAMKVKLHPRPWSRRWERAELKGVEELIISEKMVKKANHPDVLKAWNKYDLMKQYRSKITEDETGKIMSEVFSHISQNTKNEKTLKNNGRSINGKTSK